MGAVAASPPCHSVSPRDDVSLSGDFPLPQHHIPHLLTHKSPCSSHLKAPLAFGSVNLFVVCLSNENSHQKLSDRQEAVEAADVTLSFGSLFN